MALTAAELMIKISADLSELAKTLEQGDAQVTGLAKTVKKSGAAMEDTFGGIKKNWLAITAAAYGAERALAKVWEMGKRGAEFEETLGRMQRQLRGTDESAESLTRSVQALTQGQLSLAEAAQLSSRGLAQNLNPEQIRVFAQTAEALGDVMGTDVRTAFDQILDSLVTGRTAILGNIGVYVDLEKESERLALATGRTTEQITKQERAMLTATAVTGQAGAALKKFSSDMSDADAIAAAGTKVEDGWLGVERVMAAINAEFARMFIHKDIVEADFAAAVEKSRQKAFIGPRPSPGFIGPRQPPPPPMDQSRAGAAIVAATSIEVKLREEATAAAEAQQQQLREAEAHTLTVHRANVDRRLHDDVQALMAEEDAQRTSLDVQLAARDRAEDALGRFTQDRLNREYAASQQIKSFWVGQAEDMLRSNVFSLSQITTSFNTSVASWIVTGSGFQQFWQSLQMTLLSASLQFVEQALVQSALAEAAKTSAAAAGAAQRVGIASAEAGTTVSIFAGMTTAIYGMAASVGAAISALGTAIMATLVSVGQFVVGMLSAIAAALKFSVFGIPAGVLVAAGAAVLAGYLASQGNIMGAIMVGVGGLLAGAGGLGLFSGPDAMAGTGGVFGAGAGVPLAAEGAYVTGPHLMMVGEGRHTETILPFDIRDMDAGGGGEQHFYNVLDGRVVSHIVLRHQPRVAYLHGMG